MYHGYDNVNNVGSCVKGKQYLFVLFLKIYVSL